MTTTLPKTERCATSKPWLFAQMRKMVNANSIEEMRASKEILANEIGVTFNDGKDYRVDDTGLGGRRLALEISEELPR